MSSYKRQSGVLLPLFSLPGSAEQFIDFLKDAEQDYWQILPLTPADYCRSPYQSESAFAGDFVYIDSDFLLRRGYIEESDSALLPRGEKNRFLRCEKEREQLLKKAFERRKGYEKFEKFKQEEDYWLSDYALFKALKNRFDGKCWRQWDEPYRDREEKALRAFGEERKEEIEFYKFVQYLFSERLNEIKHYANSSGIKIIGDIPIYVSYDSSDVWAHRDCFLLGGDLCPKAVAGCPPDDFCEDGQLWGNPVYDWQALKESGYEWWLKRFERAAELYDCVRLDHFRGFDSFYAIPYGAKTARQGEWLQGCGKELFVRLKERLPDLEVIAEDLGFITDSVRALVRDTGYPNMKVLQFGLDGNKDNEHLARNYVENCVAYTGTHDNDTFLGYYRSLGFSARMKVRKLLKVGLFENICRAAVRELYRSKARLVIIPLADICGFGSECRINTPGVVDEKNWSYKFDSLPGAKTAEWLKELKARYR